MTFLPLDTCCCLHFLGQTRASSVKCSTSHHQVFKPIHACDYLLWLPVLEKDQLLFFSNASLLLCSGFFYLLQKIVEIIIVASCTSHCTILAFIFQYLSSWICDPMDMSLNKLWEMVKGREAWSAAVHGVTKFKHTWATEQQQQLWCWMVYLGNEPRSFCHFWHCTHELHFRFFCWQWGLLKS